MNILFIIGNGFDINIGLKTGYSDFCKWYTDKGIDNDVKKFIEYILKKSSEDDKWSDIEIALGQYTETFEGEDCIDKAIGFHDKLTFALAGYIKDQEALIVPDDIETFHRYLIEYENYGFNPKETQDIKAYKGQWGDKNRHNASVMSFNYTRSVEILTKDKPTPSARMSITSGRRMKINSIEHIHGFHNERMILGVNDKSQIANDKLHGTDAENWYVKPKRNIACGTTHDELCMKMISSTNMICLYGLSYGATDCIWWQQIVKELLLRDNIRIILFEFDKKRTFGENSEPHLLRYKKEVRDRFLNSSKVELSQEQRNKIYKKIFVCRNSDIFKLVNKQNNTSTRNPK